MGSMVSAMTGSDRSDAMGPKEDEMRWNDHGGMLWCDAVRQRALRTGNQKTTVTSRHKTENRNRTRLSLKARDSKKKRLKAEKATAL